MLSAEVIYLNNLILSLQFFVRLNIVEYCWKHRVMIKRRKAFMRLFNGFIDVTPTSSAN